MAPTPEAIRGTPRRTPFHGDQRKRLAEFRRPYQESSAFQAHYTAANIHMSLSLPMMCNPSKDASGGQTSIQPSPAERVTTTVLIECSKDYARLEYTRVAKGVRRCAGRQPLNSFSGLVYLGF